jgi:polar amino acid transport system substrate-binding protein
MTQITPAPSVRESPLRVEGDAMSINTVFRYWVAGALAATVLAASSCSSSDASGSGADLETIEPGVLKVAIQPYAPYTSSKAGKLSGLDSDILAAVANKLDLKIQPEVTDFAGMLAGVQSRRVDITIGGVAWTKERQKQGLFTEPPYYSPPAMAVASGKTYSTVKDLEGQRLGTVEGYVWVKSIKAVPGAKLGAYPDGNGVFDDLAAGRLDVGFLDPLIIIAAQKERPELKIKTQYLTPPTATEVQAKPDYDYFRPYMTSFYLPPQAKKLEKAISDEIRAMYGSGELTKLIEKWGGDPEEFLKPTPEIAKARQGVDRPADWVPPSI